MIVIIPIDVLTIVISDIIDEIAERNERVVKDVNTTVNDLCVRTNSFYSFFFFTHIISATTATTNKSTKKRHSS